MTDAQSVVEDQFRGNATYRKYIRELKSGKMELNQETRSFRAIMTGKDVEPRQ